MTDFLTVDGVVYGVLEGGASQPASEEIGEEKRAIDGTLRSSISGGKRNYRMQLEPMPQADFVTLETKSLSGNFYACAGAGIAANNYRPKIANAPYVLKDLTFLRAVDLELRQQ
jgi:hypothetical protein